MQVKIGSYTGSGSGQSITGVGFQPDLVLLKNISTTNHAHFRITGMGANKSVPVRADAAASTDCLKSLDSDGFTVGNNAAVDGSGNTIHYIAVKDNGAGDFNVGIYTGDATDGKAITGVGFQPNFVLIKSDSTVTGASKFSPNANTSMHFAGGDRTDSIVSLDADGFTVNDGSSSGGNLVNVNTKSHYWFAFKSVPNYVSVFQYTGDGTDDRNITTPNFQPGFVYIKGNNSSSPKTRFSTQSGDNSQGWDEAQGVNSIQSFISTGFQIGTENSVNENTKIMQALVIAADFTTNPSTGTHIFGDEGLIA